MSCDLSQAVVSTQSTRDRTGKRARIADRDRGKEADQYELSEVIDTPVEEMLVEEAAIVEAAPVEEKKSESSASEVENTENESKK